MLKDITCCLLLSWLVCYSPLSMADKDYAALIESSYNSNNAGFANLEHQNFGNNTILKWGDLPHPYDNNLIQLSNKLVISYGEVIMLAGDFFASSDLPISNCPPNLYKQCFYSNFLELDAISSNPFQNSVNLVPVYRKIFKKLSNEISQAKKNGTSEWEYYTQHGAEITKKFNSLTGGGNFISDYIPFGEYLKLMNTNYDHFYPGALIAYKTGHKIALQKAIKARQAYEAGKNTIAHKLLSNAYAINGFANHYLTDAMSSGHMRTPRRKIAEHVYLPESICLLIANLMHNEDNQTGLNVTNRRGISWRAYGDGFLSTPEAYQHLNLIQQLVQESADAIFMAFQSGKMPQRFEEMDLLPEYKKIDQLNNHPPLFKWENNQLLKRKSDFELNDNHYSPWWSGILTLIQFNQHYGGSFDP